MGIKGMFCSLLFALAVALAAPLAVAQQPAPVPPSGPIPGPGPTKLSLPCCDCIGHRMQLDLSTGVVPWTVTPGSGPTPTTLSAWTAAAPPAKWLQPVSPATATATSNLPSNTTYHYEVAFTVPDNCTIPYEQVSLGGKWASDNQGTIRLDSSVLGSCPGPSCFNAPTNPLSFSAATVTPGTHFLRADVTNISGYSGVLVNAVLTGRCTDKLHK
jgi:hypothetical protein